jgi:hypothetical protein
MDIVERGVSALDEELRADEPTLLAARVCTS